MLLNLLLEVDIIVSREHEILTEVSWQDNIHNINLFDDDTIWFELDLKLCHHLTGKFSFDISNSTNFYLFGEISNFFIYFFLKQFFKSVWSKVIEEFFDVFVLGILWNTNVEIDTNIHRNSDVILCWDMSNWTSESDCVLGNHDCHSLVTTVAGSASWCHHLVSCFTPTLFKNEHTVWNVKFTDAAWCIFHDNHQWNTSTVRCGNHSWSFLSIITI